MLRQLDDGDHLLETLILLFAAYGKLLQLRVLNVLASNSTRSYYTHRLLVR